MTYQQQLEQWVKGRSLHRSSNGRRNCCPDFSCCNPDLQADQKTRKRFLKADGKTRNSMLMGFLAALIRSKGHRVSSSSGRL